MIYYSRLMGLKISHEKFTIVAYMYTHTHTQFVSMIGEYSVWKQPLYLKLQGNIRGHIPLFFNLMDEQALLVMQWCHYNLWTCFQNLYT